MKRIINLAVISYLFAFCVIQNIYAQEVIQISPYTSGMITQDEIWSFSLNNLNPEAENCVLKMSFITEGSSPLVEIITPSFLLMPGLMTDFSELRNTSIYNYYQNEVSESFQNNSYAEYQRLSLCIYLFKGTENILAAKLCQEFSAGNLRALHLIFPVNNDTIETGSPLLHWEGVNIPENAAYRIRIAEILPDQDKLSALDINPPLIEMELKDNILLYPEDALKLELNKQYVWQVVATDKTKVVASSEVWVFTLAERKKEYNSSECYRIITKQLNNDNYVFNDRINFTYENRTNEEYLKYSIKNVKNNIEVKSIPEIKLENGINKVSINISEINNLKTDETYFLTIVNSKRNTYQLAFQVKK